MVEGGGAIVLLGYVVFTLTHRPSPRCSDCRSPAPSDLYRLFLKSACRFRNAQ